MFCYWVGYICNTRHTNVPYLLKSSEMQHQVVNTANLSVFWWDANNVVKLIWLLLGK